MGVQRDRILDRLWLALSGGAALSIALHGGAQLGLRPWPVGAAVLTAGAAATGGLARPSRLVAGCRDGGAGGHGEATRNGLCEPPGTGEPGGASPVMPAPCRAPSDRSQPA